MRQPPDQAMPKSQHTPDPRISQAMLRSVLGDSIADIAKDLAVDIAVLDRVFASPLAKAEMQNMQITLAEEIAKRATGDAVEQHLKASAMPAAQTLRSLLGDEKSDMQFKAAQQILKLAGYETERVEHQHSISINDRAMQLMNETLAMLSGQALQGLQGLQGPLSQIPLAEMTLLDATVAG